MFQFRRFPTYAYLIQRTLTEYRSAGFPHSEISGSTVICTSPKLIAACHVLHRLLMPRHSPCALFSLTYFLVNKKVGKENFTGYRRFDGGLCFLLLLLSAQRRKVSLWFSEFELCRLQSLKLFVLPSIKKFHNNNNVSLCCLLFILWLLCSVFKVRSDLCRNQIQTLIF